MTTHSITAPLPVQAMGRALRLLLATVAILVLITTAFVVGRVTVGSSPAQAKHPAVNTEVLASSSTGICEQVGHFFQC